MKEIFGKTSGFKAAMLRQLEQLYDENVPTNQVVTSDLADALSYLALQVGSMVGVLVDRKGSVTHVVVGKQNHLYLPDIGRSRASSSRLRGLRLIVAKPHQRYAIAEGSASRSYADSNYHIDKEFIGDLEKLQLDLVLQIEALIGGSPGRLALGTLTPKEFIKDGVAIRHHQLFFKNLKYLNEDFAGLIADLEKQLNKHKTLKTTQALIPGSRDAVVLVGVYDSPRKKWESSIAELKELARSAHVRVMDVVIQQRKKLDPRTIVGKGKLEEICLSALHKGAEVLIFDLDLSPSQLNAITDLTDLKILDRTMLILDIFAQRAKSRSGKLQVELAQLKYSLPRLAKKQSGLSRLTGGIGGQGPGETKLEVDRRRVKDKIARMDREIIKLGSERVLRRKRRNARNVPTIAIIGYTNAGKSTLLNALTGADAYSKNELFATLDPTSRRLRFPKEQEVVLIDTVGFIRDLPEGLINAFRTTLEELHEADLLLHVVDGTDSQKEQHIRVVEGILADLEINEPKRILVMNKCDALTEEDILKNCNKLNALAVSAKTGKGFEDLLGELQSFI